MAGEIATADSAVLVEAIQVFEQRIGQLVEKCAAGGGWLPTDENDELFEKWDFVLEAEAQMQARYRLMADDPALD